MLRFQLFPLRVDLRRFLELPELPEPMLTVLTVLADLLDLPDLPEPVMLTVLAVDGLILCIVTPEQENILASSRLEPCHLDRVPD
jgi:hypothetical protein